MASLGDRRAAAQTWPNEDYVGRRADILESAAAVFREHGFHGTVFKDIAAQLGVNRATLYYYFSDKEELFQAVVEGAASKNIQLLEKLVDADLPIGEKLRIAITETLEDYQRGYPYLSVFFQAVEGEMSGWRENEDMISFARRYDRALTTILADGEKSGELLLSSPARIVAFGIMGMIEGTHRWFRPDGKMTAADVAETFTSLVLDGVGAGRRKRATARR